MKNLTLTNHIEPNTTLVENSFIDYAMVEANGEFVKVYLYLLRHMNDPAGVPSVQTIADELFYTENDVLRALNYWSKQGILSYEIDSPDTAERASSADPDSGKEAPAKEASSSSADTQKAAPVSNLKEYRSRKEFSDLLYVAETYLGKTLNPTDRNTFTYLYDDLGMSADLIEYCIEYCVDLGHKSIHYINKVALSWKERGITTVEEAKKSNTTYNKNYYLVMDAFGLKGRGPATEEVNYIRRWYEEYGFSQELVLEACNRTIKATHQPRFDYAEGILSRWKAAGVRDMSDVILLDKKHQEQVTKDTQTKKPNNHNKFNNFENRTYDMSELERKLIQK